MATTRQDAWTEDEDLLLAEVVLTYIREGGTQLKAFEEVGRKLSRTPAACGFRWNSYLRKQYSEQIELAKKERKERRKKREKKLSGELADQKTAAHNIELTLGDVISYLQTINQQSENKELLEENRKMAEKIAENEKKIAMLVNENKTLRKKLEDMEKEYYSVIHIMDKARTIVERKNELDGLEKIMYSDNEKNGK